MWLQKLDNCIMASVCRCIPFVDTPSIVTQWSLGHFRHTLILTKIHDAKHVLLFFCFLFYYERLFANQLCCFVSFCSYNLNFFFILYIVFKIKGSPNRKTTNIFNLYFKTDSVWNIFHVFFETDLTLMVSTVKKNQMPKWQM